jgi:hypothetical protein
MQNCFCLQTTSIMTEYLWRRCVRSFNYDLHGVICWCTTFTEHSWDYQHDPTIRDNISNFDHACKTVLTGYLKQAIQLLRDQSRCFNWRSSIRNRNNLSRSMVRKKLAQDFRWLCDVSFCRWGSSSVGDVHVDNFKLRIKFSLKSTDEWTLEVCLLTKFRDDRWILWVDLMNTGGSSHCFCHTWERQRFDRLQLFPPLVILWSKHVGCLHSSV